MGGDQRINLRMHKKTDVPLCVAGGPEGRYCRVGLEYRLRIGLNSRYMRPHMLRNSSYRQQVRLALQLSACCEALPNQVLYRMKQESSRVDQRLTNSMEKAAYFPPWADTSIIGIAGSSGSGKTSLAMRIVASLNLPWVMILSMVCIQPSFMPVNDFEGEQDSFYKILTREQHVLAHKNAYDLDAPNAIDFDLLYNKLTDLKQG